MKMMLGRRGAGGRWASGDAPRSTGMKAAKKTDPDAKRISIRPICLTLLLTEQNLKQSSGVVDSIHKGARALLARRRVSSRMERGRHRPHVWCLFALNWRTERDARQ